MITLIYDLFKEIFKTGNWGVTRKATRVMSVTVRRRSASGVVRRDTH